MVSMQHPVPAGQRNGVPQRLLDQRFESGNDDDTAFIGRSKHFVQHLGLASQRVGCAVAKLPLYKVEPERLFAKIVVGNHAENALRVARREVVAGICNDSELLAFKARYPAEFVQLRVIWQSVEIPESPMVWRAGLDQATKLAVRNFFTKYGTTASEREKLVAINNLKRFRASSNVQLLLIADIEMFNARTQIDRNAALTLDERGAKHQEIVKRAVRLETALRIQ